MTDLMLLVLYVLVLLGIAVWLAGRDDPHHAFILELLHRLGRGTPAIVDGDAHSMMEEHEHWDSVVDRHHTRRAHL